MSNLQIAFYIVGLVYMGIMLLMVVVIVAAVLKIKTKVDHVHHLIDKQVNAVKDTGDRISTILRTVLNFVKM